MDPTTIETALRSALRSFTAGRLDEAEERCRWILSVQARHAPALGLLGNIAHRAGHLTDAIQWMQLAASVDPVVPGYHSNIGVVLLAAGRFDEAIGAFRHVLGLDPRLPDAHFNLGNALRAARRSEEAVEAYRSALALRPGFAEAHNNLGIELKRLVRFGEASSAFRQALAARPDYAEARGNLAAVLEDMGALDEALVEHRRAVEAAPDHPAIHSNLILDLHYQADVDADAILRESRAWNARHGGTPPAVRRTDAATDRPLRIGYVSPDLRRHAVATFLLPLLRSHDRRRVHVTCYATGRQVDDVTDRLREASDAWVALAGLPDAAAAQRIRDDRIDVLVDLSGHTGGNRLTLFALRPAPLQVTYLGFPGTTGVDAIDARLTDAIVDPPAFGPATSERPLRVAPTAWCFAPPPGAPDVAPLPSLREGHVTFGSFNAQKKLAPPTIASWAAILLRVPTARLLLKNHVLGDPYVADRVRRSFRAAGVEPERLELRGEDVDPRVHLQTYARVDIALDPFPYHGTTTTCEALWMGVPVITLAGSTHASRVGVSLLSAAGLPQFVADSPADYVELAVRRAGDLRGLDALRGALRERLRTSPLMDADHFAAQVETAILDLWRTPPR